MLALCSPFGPRAPLNSLVSSRQARARSEGTHRRPRRRQRTAGVCAEPSGHDGVPGRARSAPSRSGTLRTAGTPQGRTGRLAPACRPEPAGGAPGFPATRGRPRRPAATVQRAAAATGRATSAAASCGLVGWRWRRHVGAERLGPERAGRTGLDNSYDFLGGEAREPHGATAADQRLRVNARG